MRSDKSVSPLSARTRFRVRPLPNPSRDDTEFFFPEGQIRLRGVLHGSSLALFSPSAEVRHRASFSLGSRRWRPLGRRDPMPGMVSKRQSVAANALAASPGFRNEHPPTRRLNEVAGGGR
jgi:hypothetical protein